MTALTPSKIAQFFASCPDDSLIEIVLDFIVYKRNNLQITQLEYTPPGRRIKPIIVITLGDKK